MFYREDTLRTSSCGEPDIAYTESIEFLGELKA